MIPRIAKITAVTPRRSSLVGILLWSGGGVSIMKLKLAFFELHTMFEFEESNKALHRSDLETTVIVEHRVVFETRSNFNKA